MRRRDFLKAATLLPLAFLTNHQGVRGRSGDDPNILILVFDALSASNMSLYGYPRPTTPNMERFAQRATIYHKHYAGGNFTSPGTASLLTGTYPWMHRAFHHGGTVAEAHQDKNLFSVFADAGYETIAYTQNLWADLQLFQFRNDIARHLDPGEFCLVDGPFYDRLFPADANAAYRGIEDLAVQRSNMPSSLFLSLADRMRIFASEKVVNQEYGDRYPWGVPAFFKLFFRLEDAVDGIQRVIGQAARPFLSYFHLLPPHDPYNPRREFIGLFDDEVEFPEKEPHFFSQGIPHDELVRRRQAYDEYIAYCDAELGRLLDDMEQLGFLDDTYVVITSDHGELFERGIHAHDTPVLYEPLVHIPLMILAPGQEGRQDIRGLTSCIDVLPTLLHLAGQRVPPWSEGWVLPPFDAGTIDDERAIYAVEAKSNPKQAALTKATVSLHRGRHKLVHYRGYGEYDVEYELYDLENDPGEQQNLYAPEDPVSREMQEMVERKLETVNSPLQAS